MSREMYFPEVNFSPLTEEAPPYVLNPNLARDFEALNGTDDYVSFDEALYAYQDTIGAIRDKLGVDITWANRYVHFVKRKDLFEGGDVSSWAHTYGQQFLNEASGKCVRSKGGFDLYVVYKGFEQISNKDEALSLLGHEFGHSLGEHINDLDLEELKAMSFQAIFMETYQNAPCGINGKYDNRVHDRAANTLFQLRSSGMAPEQILARLGVTPFEKYLSE